MNIKYPLIIPSIGHGATDFIDYPLATIHYNILSILTIYFLKYNVRKNILILSSIIHVSNDFNIRYNYLISGLFHILWIKKPIISKLYLSFIHTPLHYYRIIKYETKPRTKIIFSNLISYLSIIGLKNNIDIILEEKLGKLWWIFPILPHIYITNKIKKINHEKKKPKIWIGRCIINIV